MARSALQRQRNEAWNVESLCQRAAIAMAIGRLLLRVVSRTVFELEALRDKAESKLDADLTGVE
jgi:hypothetical protein